MLRLDINLVFTIINVLLLYAVVRIFLFKPIKKILAARQEEVEAQYAKAEEAQADAEALKEEYAKSMSGVEDQKRLAVAVARGKASREAGRIVENAKAEAETILANAQRNAEEEKQRRLQQAQEDIADMVAQVSTKLVTASDSADNDRALFDRFLEMAAEEQQKTSEQ